MKQILLAATLAAVTIATPAIAADVGVSVSIGQPGFYGQLDIGDFPHPPVLFPQPMMIEQGSMDRSPIYLRVPPGHAKHWRKHCHEYNACGERVLFVQDNWYNREYAPRYQEQHGGRRDEGRQDGRRNERQDEGRGNSGNERRGKGNGEGHGRNH